MPRERDEAWEKHLYDDIMPDAYDEEEHALSWYYYLENMLAFPFQARCIKARPSSPLKVGETVQVIGMPGEAECDHEMLVKIRWQKRDLAVPLIQLEGIDVDEDTQEGISDWHYWVEQGYQF